MGHVRGEVGGYDSQAVVSSSISRVPSEEGLFSEIGRGSGMDVGFWDGSAGGCACCFCSFYTCSNCVLLSLKKCGGNDDGVTVA